MSSDVIKVISGVVDVLEILHKLTIGIRVERFEVKNLNRIAGIWEVGKYRTENLIFTTGAFSIPFIEPYLQTRPIWGERIDIRTSNKIEQSHHRKISISPTIRNTVRIGATHHRGVLEKKIERKDLEKLLQDGQKFVTLKDAKIVKHYGGVRSGSIDYFPIFGRVVNSLQTVKKFPQIRHGRAYPPEEYEYYKNLYIFTGLGGYGFSLAPYLAYIFTRNLETGKEMGRYIEPYRLFQRWIKKRK